MHNQPFNRVMRINPCKIGKLILFAPAESCFDRDGNIVSERVKNRTEECVKFRRSSQKSRPLPLGNDGTGGTAQVEVHFIVAHVKQRLHGPDKVLRAARQKLRNAMNSPVD